MKRATLASPPWPITAPRETLRLVLGGGGVFVLDCFVGLAGVGRVPGVDNRYRARSVAVEAVLRQALGLPRPPDRLAGHPSRAPS
jgi:hypothetical protein